LTLCSDVLLFFAQMATTSGTHEYIQSICYCTKWVKSKSQNQSRIYFIYIII